jgi:hypothetical protein
MMAHAENARPMLADIARYAAARRHDDSIGFTTFVLGRMWPMLQSRS